MKPKVLARMPVQVGPNVFEVVVLGRGVVTAMMPVEVGTDESQILAMHDRALEERRLREAELQQQRKHYEDARQVVGDVLAKAKAEGDGKIILTGEA